MNTPELEDARILIVDDDLVSLGIIKCALAGLGFRHLLLLSRSELVFDTLAEFRPDLVITDLRMPVVNGEQVIELVRQTAAPGEILPVLVVTGSGSTEAKRAALSRGAMDFLTKPIDVPELQARVRNLLRIRSLLAKTQAYNRQLEQLVAERTQTLRVIAGLLQDGATPGEEVDLNRTIRDAVNAARSKWSGQTFAKSRRIEFELDLQDVPPVQGRPAELHEVVANLVANSIDAMPAGGMISCGTRRRGERVIVEFVDTGSGMSDSVRQRCTEALFTTKGEKAPGLGLSIAAGIVERHGGKIAIESTPGIGTKVRLEFSPAAPAETETVPPRSKPLSILVVDDDAHIRRAVTRLLLGAGHSVMDAANGPEALVKAEAQRFDLLLTDQAMPGMSGVELAAVMRGVDPAPRVILFTGAPSAVASPDISCVVRKPALPHQLHAAIARVMA